MKKVSVTQGKYKGVVVSKFNIRKIKQDLKAKEKELVELIIQQLSYIGEEAVKIARDKGSYNDITRQFALINRICCVE